MMDVDNCSTLVDISNLTKGVYLMVISVDEQIFEEKLVID